jgi:hypothetical protein
MDIHLKDYQKECLEKVMEKLQTGDKYLSVVMTTGLGQKLTSLFIANELYMTEKAVIAMVFRYKAALNQTKAEAENNNIVGIDYYSIHDFLGVMNEYQYIFFHDLSVYDRSQIWNRIKGTDIKTISFSTPYQELTGEIANPSFNERIRAYAERLNPVVCVYVTNTVFDIRDAKYAGQDENKYIKSENRIAVEELQKERQHTIEERNTAQMMNTRLEAYINALRQVNDKKIIKQQAEEIARLRAQLQEPDKDKKIEELEARATEYQEVIKEKDALIAQQDQMIAFQQNILSGFGIDKEIIQKSFDQIQDVRKALRKQLESKDDDVREIALKQLQDKVTEIVSGLTQSALSSNDQDYFKDYLIGQLTESVWNRLDDKSQAFLITSRSTYESMIKMKDSETFDYSGVCLLVTKALEVETTKRFFVKYKEYLRRRYGSVSQWPFALRQRDHGQITDRVIEDNDFTLGSVVSVIGRKREYDENGDIIDYPVAHNRTRNTFLEFAGNELFSGLNRQAVEEEVNKDYHFIEKVRLDYRNPSAHRDRLTITSARECMGYVIDVQHMLREMLGNMII